MNPVVDAVFVLYNPDLELLRLSLHSLKGQVRKFFLVNNSIDDEINRFFVQIQIDLPGATLIALGDNLGIARAQNIGIARAVAEGADFTLLSDQDTLYPPNFIAEMLLNFSAQDLPSQVAAIAPCFRETIRGGEPQGFFVLGAFASQPMDLQGGCQEVPQAIASGMILQNSTLECIGLMDESLFIDWVDFEWCWRARVKGYRIVGCGKVFIEHALGDSVLIVKNKSYSIHSPVRNYYIIRNGLHLAVRYRFLPKRLRVNLLARTVKYFAAFTLLGDRSLRNFKLCAKGVVDGLRGKTGRVGLLEPSRETVAASNPKISVCIATYNGGAFLAAQLTSILGQLSLTDEVVISDDRSTDNTLDIINGFKDDRIRVYLNDLERGYSGNFENAITKARGKFLFLSDQDDVWVDGKVERMMAALDDFGLVVSNALFVDSALNSLDETFFGLRGGNQGFWANLYKSRYLGACMAFRRELLSKLLPFPKRRALCPHDLWLTLIGEFYFKVKVISEPLILYRRHGGNVSDGGASSGNSLGKKIGFRGYSLLSVLSRVLR